jgi:hypothetical protein
VDAVEPLALTVVAVLAIGPEPQHASYIPCSSNNSIQPPGGHMYDPFLVLALSAAQQQLTISALQQLLQAASCCSSAQHCSGWRHTLWARRVSSSDILW